MIKLISIFDVYDIINLKLQSNRLNLYTIKELEEVYFYEKENILILYDEISAMYDVRKLNFAYDFNINSRYLEGLQFNNARPKKDKLIEILIVFVVTKYMIEYYIAKIKNNEI